MEAQTAAISKDATIASGQFFKERDYWLNKLSGELIKSYFPYDHSKTKTTDSLIVKKDSVATSFPGDVSSRLMKLARGHDYALHMIAAAGVVVLLDRYANNSNKDIAVGAPIYKQEIDADTEFINTVLALRVHLKDDMTFKELLGQIRETMLEADEYKNYPIEILVSQLNMSMSEHDFPLFDVAVLMEDIHDISYLHPVNINMIFCFRKSEDSMELEVQYNASLYERATVERIGAHFIRLLQQVLFNVDIRLSDVDITTVEERKQLLKDFNNAAVEYPRDKFIHDLFEEQAEKRPDGVAVAARSEGARHTVPFDVDYIYVTYNELNQKSNQLAHYLRQKGVTTDTNPIVAIMLERSVEMIIGILGILKAGGAYLPIDPDYPQERKRYMLADCNARILLSEVSEVSGETEVIDLPSLIVENEDAEPAHLTHLTHPTHLCYVIYTSGTTGRPKGVMIEHRNVVRLMVNDKFTFDFDDRDVWTMFHSYCFDFSVWEIYGALLYGGKLLVIPKWTAKDTREYLHILKTWQVTVLNQTPSAFYSLINEELSSDSCGLS
ncbi:MAG: AMP-binding protein, partial [Candidatus Aminicenantes bacterium]|nr:AMP-binding protein [Candidatus Aminicenantes bacterium]NIM77282.1 AMP-binding protein [Candidatus Aminicenantes bacterium]NIN16583.1 AMP-binding protein [Candidatus Aminicenantes bacterium]NIN40441.1 AMP-binding protein [Candidatus Aminicenantes bacterium]NIN83261.1 AMP-binding protein [Candidatus Aminicenantes bacterium]